MIKDKKGGFTDLLLFIILAFAIVLTTGIFLYIGVTVSTQLHLNLDNSSTTEINYTTILSQSIDPIPTSYQILKWGSTVLIVAMIFSIFIGSYLVTTKPIFFVPYFVVVIIADIFAVIVANAYDELIADATLGATLRTFTASNFILLNLPIVVAVVGFVGAIIMYASYKVGSVDTYQ